MLFGRSGSPGARTQRPMRFAVTSPGSTRRGRARGVGLGSMGGGGVGQRVDAGLGLRERDHLADVLLAREDRDEAVDADGEARRAAVRRSGTRRAGSRTAAARRPGRCRAARRSAAARRGGGYAPSPNRAPNRSARGRTPATRTDSGSRLQPVDVVGVRHRERVVRGDRAAVVVEPFEQREVDDPQEARAAFGHRRAAEVEPQLPEHRRAPSAARPRRSATGRPASRAERVDERRAARPPTGTSRPATRARRRRARASTRDPARPATSRGRSARRASSAPCRPRPATRMPLIASAPANARNSVAANTSVELDELHAEAHVGLVGAVALHRLVPRHPRDRRRRLARAARPRPRRAPPPTPRRARPPGRRSVISTSSCMNSNCRSARRSSSRRQRAIWK